MIKVVMVLDATQSTAAAQPRIVNAGVVEVRNGKPTITFNGTTQFLTRSTGVSFNATEIDAFYVSTNFSGTTALHRDRPLVEGRHYYGQAGWAIGGTFSTLTLTGVGGQAILSYLLNSVNTGANFKTVDSAITFAGDPTGLTRFFVGAGVSVTAGVSPNEFFNGDIQEVLWFKGVSKLSERGSIVTNMNNFYDVVIS